MNTLTQKPTNEQPATAKNLLAHQIIDVFEVMTQQADELDLSELEWLEKELTATLKNNIIDAIAQKQVHTVFEGYAVDPVLPDGFDFTPNDERPESHAFWWCRPYIVTRGTIENKCYWVECLDGGAWDRPTFWGESRTLKGAAEICRTGPNWTNRQSSHKS